MSALVPIADWSRVRIVLNGKLQRLSDGVILAGVRRLDRRPGTLLAHMTVLAHNSTMISGQGELRWMVLDSAIKVPLLIRFLQRLILDRLLVHRAAVLMCAGHDARDSEAQNIELLKQISSDRSTVVDAMRRRPVKAANQETVYRLTSLFERAVWLAQRYALLLQSANVQR